MDTASSCQSCGQPITKEDLAEGLSVRVDGRLVCSSCVDQLPGEAQVRINQLRAVRGLAATTYRVASARHPRLKAFTYTTSVNLNLHRRELAATGTFDAPLLPATGAPRLVLPLAPSATRRPPVALLAGGAALVLATVGVVVVLATRGGDAPAKPSATTPPMAAADPTPAAPARTRTDYAADAAVAWTAATSDPSCPMAVVQTIAGELVNKHAAQVAIAEQALESGDHRAAADAMGQVTPLPDHLLFRTASKRATEVSDRIRMARVAAITAPVAVPTPAPEPSPPPATPVEPTPPAPTPPIAVVVPPAPVPAPEPAPPAPAVGSGDCLLFNAKSLGELPGRKDWASRSAEALILESENGSLTGHPTVAGGSYQLWLKARGLSTPGTVQVILNGQRSVQLQVAKLKVTDWMRVEPAFTLEAGQAKLQLVAIGAGTIISEIYLADASQPAPLAAIAEKRTTAPAFATDAVAIEPAAAARPAWIPRFAEAHPTLDPAVDANRVPLGLPGNSGAVLESAKGRNGGRHCFTLEVAPDDVRDGGMALLLSPRRSARTALTVTAIDESGRRFPLDGLPLGKDLWQVHTIDLSRAVGVRQVLVEDESPLSTGFLLAKAAVAAGKAPTPELLDLRPPALLPFTSKHLDDELTFLASRRKAQIWRKSFEPTNLKMLIGQKLTMGSWDTEARKRLQEVMGIQRLPNKTVEALVMNDAWLDDLVKPPAGSDPVLDTTRHHLVIICTAGIEFPTGLDGRQAFVNVWKKLIVEVRNRGVLPVPVLGPSKVDGEDRAEVEKLWSDLAEWLGTKYPGIPIIDLRPAAAASADRFAPGGAKLSIDLLGDGYGTLLRRIEALRKPSR